MADKRKLKGKIEISYFESGEPDVNIEGDVDPGNIRGLAYLIQIGFNKYLWKRRDEELRTLDARKAAVIEKQIAEAKAVAIAREQEIKVRAAAEEEREIKKAAEREKIKKLNELVEAQRIIAKQGLVEVDKDRLDWAKKIVENFEGKKEVGTEIPAVVTEFKL